MPVEYLSWPQGERTTVAFIQTFLRFVSFELVESDADSIFSLTALFGFQFGILITWLANWISDRHCAPCIPPLLFSYCVFFFESFAMDFDLKKNVSFRWNENSNAVFFSLFFSSHFNVQSKCLWSEIADAEISLISNWLGTQMATKRNTSTTECHIHRVQLCIALNNNGRSIKNRCKCSVR